MEILVKKIEITLIFFKIQSLLRDCLDLKFKFYFKFFAIITTKKKWYNILYIYTYICIYIYIIYIYVCVCVCVCVWSLLLLLSSFPLTYLKNFEFRIRNCYHYLLFWLCIVDVVVVPWHIIYIFIYFCIMISKKKKVELDYSFMTNECSIKGI